MCDATRKDCCYLLAGRGGKYYVGVRWPHGRLRRHNGELSGRESVKYLYKYVYKSPDRAMVATLASGEDVNEIQLFQDAPAARSASHDPHPLLRPTGD